MERLQKVISNSGVCSRRQAEKLIQEGKVIVNDKVITELGTKVNPNDSIIINGQELKREDKEYYLLYKPRGVICTNDDDKKRKTVIELIDTDKRIYPVGRLDYDTTGILLLTNDGELTNKLLHPKNDIEKVYVAKIKGFLTKETIAKLEKGIFLDGVKTKRSKIKVIRYDKKANKSYVRMTLTEGRNHQVKNMFTLVGSDVEKLKRESFSFLTLEGLKPGEYRTLSPKEVKKLYNL